jgi:hypothetical protein
VLAASQGHRCCNCRGSYDINGPLMRQPVPGAVWPERRSGAVPLPGVTAGAGVVPVSPVGWLPPGGGAINPDAGGDIYHRPRIHGHLQPGRAAGARRRPWSQYSASELHLAIPGSPASAGTPARPAKAPTPQRSHTSLGGRGLGLRCPVRGGWAIDLVLGLAGRMLACAKDRRLSSRVSAGWPKARSCPGGPRR